MTNGIEIDHEVQSNDLLPVVWNDGFLLAFAADSIKVEL
jgi:hypothetical protein